MANNLYMLSNVWTNSGTGNVIVAVEDRGENVSIEIVDTDENVGQAALRPYHFSALQKFFPAAAPRGTAVEFTTNPGRYGSHPSVRVIIPVYYRDTDIVLRYIEKRYRTNQAVWDYTCPKWVLPFLARGQNEGIPEATEFVSPTPPVGYEENILHTTPAPDTSADNIDD